MILEINTREEAIANAAIYAITNNESLFHVRIGDGEAIMIKPEICGEHFFENYVSSQLGYIPTHHELETIKNCLVECVVYSDLLGLPEVYHQKSGYWKHSVEIIENILKEHIINRHPKDYCSIDSHLQLLSSGQLDRIIQTCDNVTLVTSRPIVEPFIKKFNHIKTLNLFLTPGEFQFEEPGKEGFNLAAHDHIVSSIKREDRRGQLCLFGAGFIGKNIGREFAASGGVAIDIGSVFDLWAGKNTRGANKGRTAVNNQFKL